jgi:uncharacterized membrane protein YhfC
VYLALQTALIVFYVALVGAAIALARSKYHTAFSLAAIGAITIAVGSVSGGFVGGVLRGTIFGTDVRSMTVATAAQIVGAMAFAGFGEEVARIVVLRWRYRHRNDRLEDMLMFGAGFGGAEVIYRAYLRLAAFIAGSTAVWMTPWGSVWVAITCVEIFIFHIFLTLLVYRSVRRPVLRPALLLGLIVLYHGGLDFCGGMMGVLLGAGYAALLWSVLTPIHIWVILRLLDFRVRVRMGSIDSTARRKA